MDDDFHFPSPQTTLAILLGASKWPYCSMFQPSEAFANAARGFKEYLLSSEHFALPKENLFDLFDSCRNVDEIDDMISQFLEKRTAEMKLANSAVKDILIYFVGHGGFTGRNQDFFLAISRTRESNLKISGLQMEGLAETLRNRSRHSRFVIILDCCYAGSAFTSFQANPAQVAIKKTIDIFEVKQQKKGLPKKGIALLCSSDHKTASLLLSDDSSTMFSHALLNALSQGTSRLSKYLSLREVKDLAENFLHDLPTENAPTPVVHSPDQSDGDVADIPFFPNPAIKNQKIEDAFSPMPTVIELIENDWLSFILGIDSEGEKMRTTLFEAGHILLAGGSMGKTNAAKSVCLQLCSKAPITRLQVAILDLAAQKEQWEEFSQFRHVKYITSDRNEVEQCILSFEKVLDRRQKDTSHNEPTWLIIIEDFTDLEPSKIEMYIQLAPNAVWEAFIKLLQHGKEARIFILATTRRLLASGTIHDLFHTKSLFSPDPNDDSVDALALTVDSLTIPASRPIIYLRVRQDHSKLMVQCPLCKGKKTTYAIEYYINYDRKNKGLLILDEEAETQSWLQLVIEQVTGEPRLYHTDYACLNCTVAVLDAFMGKEGIGRSLVKEVALAPKKLQPLISYIVFKQFGQPNMLISCTTSQQTIQKIIEDIQVLGMLDLEKCPNCGNTLQTCTMCKQLKCFACADTTATGLEICLACLNEYDTSVISHLSEAIVHPEIVRQKQWCEVCNDWMLQSHQHRPPKLWT